MKSLNIAVRLVSSVLPDFFLEYLNIGRPSRQGDEKEYYQNISDLLNGIEADQTIMDFGCGTRRISRHIPCRALYVDKKKYFNKNDPDFEIYFNGLKALEKFPSDSLDACISISVLQYLTPAQCADFFLLTSRLLKRGGLLLIEVDGRDLLSGVDAAGNAPYLNEFSLLSHNKHASFFQKTGLYTNNIPFKGYIEMAGKHFIHINSESLIPESYRSSVVVNGSASSDFDSHDLVYFVFRSIFKKP